MLKTFTSILHELLRAGEKQLFRRLITHKCKLFQIIINTQIVTNNKFSIKIKTNVTFEYTLRSARFPYPQAEEPLFCTHRYIPDTGYGTDIPMESPKLKGHLRRE